LCPPGNPWVEAHPKQALAFDRLRVMREMGGWTPSSTRRIKTLLAIKILGGNCTWIKQRVLTGSRS